MAAISGTGSVELPHGHVLDGLTIYGACAQDGTPSPDNPVEIKRITSLALSTSDGQTVEVDLQGHDMCNVLNGVRDVLTIGGDGRKTLTKRTVTVTFDGSEDWARCKYTHGYGYYIYLNPHGLPKTIGVYSGTNIVSNQVVKGNNSGSSANSAYFAGSTSASNLDCIVPQFADLAAWESHLAEHPMTVIYALLEPYDIDLGYVELPDVRDASTLSVIADVEPEIEVSTCEYSIAGGGASMNGRNLLRFTGHPTYAGDNTAANREIGWCSLHDGTLERTEDGMRLYSESLDAGYIIPTVPGLQFTGGESEVLTLSFQYRTSFRNMSFPIYMLSPQGGVWRRSDSVLVYNETEWQTFENTFYFPDVGNRVPYAVYLPSRHGSWLEIKDGTMKLEYGTTATPWRPAPEDTEQPSDVVYASEGVDLGDTSGLATDAAARGYASDAQAAATAAAAADATGKANAAQAAAELTAAADATSKANAAQAAANGYADAQVATRARTFATGWTYALTADASVDASKTYYTRSGSGTEQDPYVYTEVASPTAAGLPTYYEMVPETPAPPYSQGDMWLQGDGGAILVCVAAKEAGGAYAAEDWEPASGYTDDSSADALSSGMAALADADAELAARMDTADAANQAAMAEMDARVATAEGTAAGVSARLVSLEDYVRVVGGDHLELGKAGSAVTASLENDRLAFLLVGQDAPVAYIAADEDGTGKLFVTQAVVVSELQFGHGNWAWTERKNGNMALKWRGGEA